MHQWLANYFQLREKHTRFHTEIIAGCTTFLTMIYIVIVCPAILHTIGIDARAVFTATCCAAAIGSFLMGIIANYPIALAPSMSLIGYFAFSVVQKSHVPWQTALGAVFIAGVLFLLLAVSGIRQKIMDIISPALKLGLTAGIGLFLAVIALKNLNIIAFGQHHIALILPLKFSLVTGLSVLGLGLIILLEYFKIPGAILLSILSITLIGIALHVSAFYGVFSLPPSLLPVAGALDIKSVFQLKLAPVIFSFFLVAFFDNTGTLIGILHQAKLLPDNTSRLAQKNISRALSVDSIASIIGALLGTSSVGSYIESSAGVRAGGRTGLTAVIVSLLFLLALFFSPLAQSIPDYATAPVLFYIALQMLKSLRDLPWHDWSETFPACMITLAIPFTFSIAQGIGLGLIIYFICHLLTRQYHKLSLWFIILTLIFTGYLFF